MTAGAASKLIVNAARIVPLSPNDMQSANSDYFLVFLFDFVLNNGELALQFLLRNGLGSFALLLQAFPHEEIGISAEQNIGTSTGHIGRYRYCALTPRLGDDGSFTFVILRVQDLVPDAHLLQKRRQSLGFFDRNGANQHRPSLSFRSLISFAALRNFSSSVRYTTSGFSLRIMGRLVGITVTSSL